MPTDCHAYPRPRSLADRLSPSRCRARPVVRASLRVELLGHDSELRHPRECPLDIRPGETGPNVGLQQPEVGRVEALLGEVDVIVVAVGVIDPDPALVTAHLHREDGTLRVQQPINRRRRVALVK